MGSPESLTTSESLIPTSELTPKGHVSFTDEQRETLLKLGWSIHDLTGQTIANLRDAKYPIWTKSTVEFQFEQVPSLNSQVAVKLPYSDYQLTRRATFHRFLHLTNGISKINSNLPVGTDYMLGSAADYMELGFSLVALIGKEKYQSLYGCDHFVTTDIFQDADESLAVTVGTYDVRSGFGIRTIPLDMCASGRVVVPLVVPSQALESR